MYMFNNAHVKLPETVFKGSDFALLYADNSNKI